MMDTEGSPWYHYIIKLGIVVPPWYVMLRRYNITIVPLICVCVLDPCQSGTDLRWGKWGYNTHNLHLVPSKSWVLSLRHDKM